MDFALPASLFAATASASRREMIEQVPLFLVLGVTMLLLYLAWYFAARRFSKVSRSEASLQALTIGFPNLAGVGLPIMTSVVGPTGTVPVAVALAAGSILISPLTLIMAEMGAAKARGEEMAARQVLTAVRRAITKPVVLAPALGILFSLSDVSLDALAHASLALIGSSAAGVALFLTGAILSAQSFRLDWKIIAATLASDIVRPLLAVAVIRIIPVAPDAAKTAILLAAVPSGFFGILFAVNYRLDSARAGSMVIASTAFSVVTLAIAIAMLFPN
jgi:malonate transporter